MIGKEFDITRRRVLFTIVVIGLASAAAGAGTMAYFSDTETSSNNNVTAGTLDLTIGGGDANVNVLSVDNAKPAASATNNTNLTNDGSVNGTLNVTLDVTSSENDQTEPEAEVDNSSDGDGELYESNMNVTVGLDTDHDGAIDITIGEGAPSSVADSSANTSLNAGESVSLVMEYDISKNAGNEIQTDTVTINATITLEQTKN